MDHVGKTGHDLGTLQETIARLREVEARAERRAVQQSVVAHLSRLALGEQDFTALAQAAIQAITASPDVARAGLIAIAEPDRPLAGDVLDPDHVRDTLAAGTALVVGDAAAVTAPVIGEGSEPFGVLGLAADAPHTFDEDDLAFLQSVANVLTGALRRLAAEQGLRHQALHDPLTQLPNRALLLDRLRLAVARRRRQQTWVAVLYLDLDDFMAINDSLGHAAGDELLRALAPRLSDVLRPSDTLARLGGDEFAILCEGLDEVTESTVIAERLLAVVAQPVEIAGVELRPTASIGIALAGPGTGNDGDDLLRDGGVAMERAKAAGRGRYELFDDHMRAETVERVALTHELRRAIEDGDLRLVYQPMVRFAEGRAHGFEALVRWTHPQRGEIPPDRFIPLAEQHGLIEPLGRWVLREALDQLRRWRDAGLTMGDMAMSVNVSRVQLSRPGLAQEIFDVLAERGLAPRQLVVEVTESAVMDDPTVANATLDALAEAGVRIALDDFGVGQSSLACLRDLPLDALKLDRGFITSLASSRQAAAIVRAVCDMARTLGFSVVAEGVETEAQSQVVEALGCDVGQGFLYARPVSPQEIPAVFAELDRRLGADAGAPALA